MYSFAEFVKISYENKRLSLFLSLFYERPGRLLDNLQYNYIITSFGHFEVAREIGRGPAVMCVSNCTMGQYWRRYRFFYWVLRGCAGNWGKIRPLNSPIVHFNRIPSQSQMSNLRKEIMILIPCFSPRIMQKSNGNFHALSVKPSTGVCTLLLCHSISLRCLQRFYV